MNPNIAAFKELKYGMMMHFGLYSLLGGYWRGKQGPKYAEWIECYHQIPNAEIERLARIFNPIYFDADEICEVALKAGMRYIVVTAKHHEGFALFKSDADPFNSVDFTPCGRDLIGELADACRRHGLRLGLYYSQCIDWHEEHGGGCHYNTERANGKSWENAWDWPDKSRKDFSICFERKILPQVKELMSRYGDIFLVWFDTPLDMKAEYSQILYDTVKTLQPDCLVNSRLGNGMFDYVTLGDNEIPDEIPKVIVDPEDKNEIRGFKNSPHGLYECACTLNRSWGWNMFDEDWKSPETLAATRLKLERLGINYLVNVGPDHLGRIPLRSLEILHEANCVYERQK